MTRVVYHEAHQREIGGVVGSPFGRGARELGPQPSLCLSVLGQSGMERGGWAVPWRQGGARMSDGKRCAVGSWRFGRFGFRDVKARLLVRRLAGAREVEDEYSDTMAWGYKSNL
uniref:Uncharacterized protein n=1 Tax=Oryza punctata TaxID=4537 RepID=A0A0E0JHA4_ORYPU